MIILYDIFFIFFALLYIPYLFLKKKWHAGFWTRLGFLPPTAVEQFKERKNIWVHAVSVGEVITVLPILEELRSRFPECRIVLTTVTKTGYGLAKEKLPKEDALLFAPLDFSLSVRSFVQAIRPEIYVAVETEIWPNLFACLHRHKVPIVMINARISDKAWKGYQRLRFLLKGILIQIDWLCVQTPVDAQRLVKLGASPDRVSVTGSLKFDFSARPDTLAPGSSGLDPDQPLLIAGSTHPGEEEILIRVYQALKDEFKDLRLLIAPRHVERAEEVVSLVKKQGLTPVKFSRLAGRKVDSDEVVVVDTIGHLRQLYRFARVVFIGKSLVPGGGQNIIEPAVFGKPILVGPHMENFRDITQMFVREQALIQVQDEQELLTQLQALLRDPARAMALGQRAAEVVKRSAGAKEKILERIAFFLRK